MKTKAEPELRRPSLPSAAATIAGSQILASYGLLPEKSEHAHAYPTMAGDRPTPMRQTVETRDGRQRNSAYKSNAGRSGERYK